MRSYSLLLRDFERSGYFKGKNDILELWERTYKSKYVSPEGYHDWSFFSKLCFWLGHPHRLKAAEADETLNSEYKVMLASCAYAIVKNAPGFFLSLELLRCLLKTEVPAIDEQPKFPFPVFCVLFHKKLGLPKVNFPGEKSITHRLSVVGLVVKERPNYVNGNEPDGVAHVLCVEDYTGNFVHMHRLITWSKVSSNDIIENLVKHLVLLYNNKRELFTEEKVVPVRGTGFGKTGKKADPEPTRFIGKFFENKVRYVGRSRGDKGGAKKRPHWRRGHWHKVCYGEGRKERKYQWFQPVYVCPSEEDSSETS
jgi:hypothetical protein